MTNFIENMGTETDKLCALIKKHQMTDIIEQKKFCRPDNVHYISDSLARICNSLKLQTGTALHLDLKDNQQIVIKFATKYKIGDTIIEEYKKNDKIIL